MTDTLSLDAFERIALGQRAFTLSETQWTSTHKTHDYLLEQIARRLLSLSRGYSGASPALVQRLMDCLNEDFVPEIPSQGTVGASGDLTPLAHLARALSGGGRVRLKGGHWQPAETAHQELGWQPLQLAGKDAIALVNGTALVAELRSDAIPASIQSIPTNADNQDIVPLGTIAARKAASALDILQKLLAIEAMVLSQAMDIEGADGFSKSSRQLQAWVRRSVSRLEGDRPLAEDIEALAGKIADPDAPWWTPSTPLSSI